MIQLALIAARGTSTAMILSKAQKAGHVITSVISVSEKALKAAGKNLLDFFRITTGKNAGQLNQRALKGMNHSAATASSAEKTLFAANVAAGRFTPAQANIFTRLKNGLLSPSEARTLFMRTGMTAATVAAIFPLLEDEDEDAKTEYNVLTGKQESKGDIKGSMEETFPSETRPPDFVTGHRISLKTDPYRDDKRALRSRVPEYAVSTLRAVPVHTTRKSPEQLAKDAETDAARQWIREQNRSHDARIAMEKAAIRDASPRFTQAELSPYKKVAEPGFGQKLFGLRRSAPEIERDVTYLSLIHI